MQRRAFTLIELLVVISVIGILAGMLMPAISLVRESSRKANCGSNQRQIVLSMILYTTEYRKWPDHSSAAAADRGTVSQGIVLAKLGEDHKLYICPSEPKAIEKKTALQDLGTNYAAWNAGMTSYAYDYQTPITAKPGKVVMADRNNGASPPLTVHKKLTMAGFADGHVGNINLRDPFYPNPEAGDADIYSGTTGDADANVR